MMPNHAWLASRSLRYVITLSGVTLVYFIAGRWGLSLAVLHRNVSLVWPPTGIALAAILIFGYRFGPAVFLGALWVNALTAVGMAASIGIAAGNTLEALTGAYLLKQFLGFDRRLERLRDVIGLIGWGGMVATVVSATIGVTVLCITDNNNWALYGRLWIEWWLGDFLGALIVAPFILVWSSRGPFSWTLARTMETIFFSTVLIGVSGLIFGSWYRVSAGNYLYIFSLFPVVSWAALRFGLHGATVSAFVISSVAVWGTVHGYGPFAVGDLDQGLLYLQIFTMVVVSMALILAASTSERKQVEGRLRQLNDSRTEFVSIISHELRTPLFSIKEGIQQVLDRIEGEITPGQEDNLKIVMSNVDRLARLTNKILDSLRLESGKMQMVFELTSMNDLMTELFRLMQLDAHSKGIDLTLDIPSYPVSMICDPDKVKQVVINLVNNALKFTVAGDKVYLRLAAFPQSIRIEVADTGVGIKKEDQGKIFDMFSQGSASLASKAPGAGMGLRICKLIVKQHGGTISVDSSPGVGSKFTVIFPRSPAR